MYFTKNFFELQQRNCEVKRTELSSFGGWRGKFKWTSLQTSDCNGNTTTNIQTQLQWTGWEPCVRTSQLKSRRAQTGVNPFWVSLRSFFKEIGETFQPLWMCKAGKNTKKRLKFKSKCYEYIFQATLIVFYFIFKIFFINIHFFYCVFSRDKCGGTSPVSSFSFPLTFLCLCVSGLRGTTLAAFSLAPVVP